MTPAALQTLAAQLWRDTRLSLNVLLLGLQAADVRALDAQMDTHPPRRIHWVLLDGQATRMSRQELSSGHLTIWPGAGPEALRAGVGQFHGIWLDVDLREAKPLTQDWSKALRAHLWRDSWLLSPLGMGPTCQQQWQALGWDIETAAPLRATYRPRWLVADAPAAPDHQVTVIGAGLAGAACAHTLSQRGWQVDWLEAEADVAQGASGLPVGMLSAHRTAQATPMSELAAHAMPHTLAALRALLPGGQGWVETRVDNLPSDRGGPPPGQDQAWLIEPSTLVRAWWQSAMQTGRVRWLPGQTVSQLIRTDQGWQSLDARGQALSTAPHVIAANAFGARALLGTATGDIRAVAGQMSWAPWPADQPPCAPHPRRAHGVLTPSFDGVHGRIWAVGSTYRRGVAQPTPSERDHDANGESLARLCPEALDTFHAQRARGETRAFVGVRCASPDRLPLLGNLPTADARWPARGGLAAVTRQTGLHVVTALGSRGLTLAAWAAHTLADQLEHIPLDTPASLVQACDPARKGMLDRKQPQAETRPPTI